MESRSCRQCVYAGRSTGRWLKIILLRWPGLLFCTNCAEAPGELRDIPATGICRNFRPRRGPVVRLAPPEPPNDDIRYIPLTRGKFAIVDAARAYDRKARELFGEFAYLNFPEDVPAGGCRP